MQAPAQSSQLLPGPFVFSRLCSALTLAGLAFYACAPELIAPELAPLPAQRQKLHAGGSAIRHGHCHMHSVTNQVSATALLRAHSPRLRAACVAPWLSCPDCASCAGEILCLHAPAPLSKVRAIARIWISRVNGNIISSFLESIGNKGARPCLAPGVPALAHLHDRPWPCNHDSLTTPWP